MVADRLDAYILMAHFYTLAPGKVCALCEADRSDIRMSLLFASLRFVQGAAPLALLRS